ncbi:ATP-binding protein [Stigmatella sp. ncwal1]|uniref:histidine kinase n=1 Tax=Stigmatella ashevillensis TaxID=2995309 RepID=A0ABT5DC93_9BACT|nr:ATP-binding protein [Stigmatella ashevillena]MDC0711295.1 ATP-binding protein [Stigmatella ashevillena]
MSVQEPPPPSRSESHPLRGGGACGALMRQVDWSKTAIGPVEQWPQSLRTAVGILLNSNYPLYIAWGPRYVQLYNDAYRPICGATKHPAALGQEAQVTWPEVWHLLGPGFDKILATGEANWVENLMMPLDRNGFIEECYFTYSHSPILDETGGVGGVFAALSETTKQVLDARRMHTLKDLSVGTADMKSAKAACEAAARILAQNPHDVPFALLYLVAEEGHSAHLVGAAGLQPGSAHAPFSISLREEAPWSLREVIRTGTGARLEGLAGEMEPLPGGPWPEAATTALVLPLTLAGHAQPSGAVILGVSPRCALDDKYESFLKLVGAQAATTLQSARAFEEEQKRAEALAKLDQAKTAFFSNISHEFRTPLTLMLGPIEDGLQDTEQPLPPRQRDRQQTVHRNGIRLLKLVNTLLDFSRIEAGRVKARYQPTDLSAFTADLASAFRSLMEKAGLFLQVNCPRLSAPVYVDREMYEKVVLNLLSNAFKFTFTGGVRVSLKAEAGRVVLAVADTGTGIPEAELPHVFERFHRVEGARGRSHEGSGIGLALIQELVRLHAGTLTVQSTLGQGSRFTVTLPLGTAHLPAEQVMTTAAPATTGLSVVPFMEEAALWTEAVDVPGFAVHPTGTARAPESAHILLADDNADIREYVRQLLTAQGWTVETATDGEAALARALAHPPHLVLTDVMMPRLDGFGLLQALKAHEKTRHVPVILLSARAGEEATVEGLQQGADDYLVKPFSAKELVSRIAARLEIARARSEAAHARERLHSQFMQAPVAMSVVKGPTFVYELANPLYLEMLGRQGQNLTGKSVREVLPELPEEAPVLKMLEDVFSSGTPFMAEEYCVSFDRTGTGRSEDVYFKVTCQPVRGADGQVTDIITVAVDVTEQVQARRRSEALAQELKLADQRKDEFLAMLAHELRNPMAAISLSLSMLERSEGNAAKLARHRETARRQMGNLVRLVDDLLDVSRITRGKMELRQETVDFALIVQNALSVARPLIEARGHGLSVTLAPGAFRMNADATRLEQVVVNLLTNAAKYTEPGGHLSVSLSREGVDGTRQAVLRVKDTGRGIPRDMLGKVFDLFTQVAPSIDRSTGGLGLGLTLVKRLVEMHGGSAEAFSEGPGKGSEFAIRLPLARRLDARDRPPGASPQPCAAFHKQRILLVEDSADIRASLTEFLEDLGHEVTAAKDGLEGVERLLALRPDVALIDVGLPGIDGYEVARRVRAEPGGEQLYLVALTGYGGPEAKAKAERAGFDLHLTKPVNIDELPRIVAPPEQRSRG